MTWKLGRKVVLNKEYKEGNPTGATLRCLVITTMVRGPRGRLWRPYWSGGWQLYRCGVALVPLVQNNLADWSLEPL